MPHWAWVALMFGIIVGLFGFLLYVEGGEPTGRDDTAGTNGLYPSDVHHDIHDGGVHH